MRMRTVMPWVWSAAAGAAITVGVAWAFALMREQPAAGPREAAGILDPQFPSDGWLVFVLEGHGSTRLMAHAKNFPEAPAAIPWWTSLDDYCRERSATREIRPNHREMWIIVEDAAGWPVRALRSRSETVVAPGNPVPALQCFGTPAFPKPPGTAGSAPVVLPLLSRLPVQPIWHGFALETAAWGSLVWCVVWGPGALRRWHRRRAGKCVRCGYLLPAPRSASCPECGAGTAAG